MTAQERGIRAVKVAARAFVGLIAIGAIAALAAERRQALWPVVQSCVLDLETTGSPFPCLYVDLSRGEAQGYAILRPPVGRPDTILSPTRRIPGLEDPWLRSAEAPNYFVDAWRHRELALNGERAAREPDLMALAVNSRYVRTQDQLHFHIGCPRPRLKAEIVKAVAAAPVGDWMRLADDPLPRTSAWIYRTGSTTLAEVAPFQLAYQKFGDQLLKTTLLVAPAPTEKGQEFVLLAFPDQVGRRFEVSAEDLLDASCSAYAP